MKTQFEFKTSAFPPMPGEEDEMVNPGMYGKALSLFLADELNAKGYEINLQCAEDWGWYTEIANDGFRLEVGCGTHDWESRTFTCFVMPDKPVIRKWFKKISTEQVVGKLVADLNDIFTNDERFEDVELFEA